MENNDKERAIRDLQRHFFGEEFTGATLSGTRLNSEHASRVADWLKNKKNFLILLGKPGCGKTYLCSAICSWIFSKVRDIYVMKESKFFEKVRQSMEMKGDYNQAVEYQADHEFLILDDLGSTGLDNKPWRIEIIFSLVDLRKQNALPTIFTSNLTPNEIKEILGQRIYSRLFATTNCFIDMFDYPDYRLQKIQEINLEATKEGIKKGSHANS